MHFLYYYLLGINVFGLIVFGIDKWKAVHHRWRIRESMLLTFALFGGSIGCLLGMIFFRHKIRKPKFTIGIPMILLIQLGLFLVFKL